VRRDAMRTFWTTVLMLAVPLVVTADDKKEPIAPEGTTVKLILLRQKSVQDELKCDADLVKKIMTFTNKEADEYSKSLKLSEKEREKKEKELEEANTKFLTDNLTAAQRKRLDQITLQVTGLYQLSRPDVVKELELTDKQQKKIKELRTDAEKQLKEIASSKERKEKHEKLAKLREKNYEEIDSLLTDKQKEKVREMVGERFKGKLKFEEGEDEGDDSLSQDNKAPADKAIIVVKLPDNAKLTIDGDATKATGPERRFVTPSLKDGTYSYTFAATWLESGKKQKQEKKVSFRAGQVVEVVFGD